MAAQPQWDVRLLALTTHTRRHAHSEAGDGHVGLPQDSIYPELNQSNSTGSEFVFVLMSVESRRRQRKDSLAAAVDEGVDSDQRGLTKAQLHFCFALLIRFKTKWDTHAGFGVNGV